MPSLSGDRVYPVDALREFTFPPRRSAKRSTRREVSGTMSASNVGPVGADPSPGSQAAQNEERESLRRAIDATDGDDRRILELVHEQGKDFAEAGRAMGRSAEAARKLYGRVILRLGRQVRGGGSSAVYGANWPNPTSCRRRTSPRSKGSTPSRTVGRGRSAAGSKRCSSTRRTTR